MPKSQFLMTMDHRGQEHVEMPKRSSRKPNAHVARPSSQATFLHHLEEASTHLRAAELESANLEGDYEGARLRKMQEVLKLIYNRHTEVKQP